ncbi:hypothetical protein [Sediminibacillus terrae]|uniref:hypothetical protein n=1 Tax=Sediminibacillus terrae TaxID=1562106 RepID=UPI0012969579|nr:hypothetical protein [Sediminibacillus terrae]
MKGICVDPSQSALLEENKEYFIFPNGATAFYVSKFNRKGAHFGCFQADRFEVIAEDSTVEKAANEPPDKVDSITFEKTGEQPPIENMELQLSIFDIEPEETGEKNSGYILVQALIPEDLISPVHCTSSPKSKAFKKVQQQWGDYGRSIQNQYKCSWAEATKILEKHRDNQQPISLSIHPGSDFRPEVK